MTQTVTNINTQVILAESPTAAGVSSSVFILRAETFFLSVDISAISGTLDIKAETIDEATGELKEVITFDQFSAVTPELQFKTANYSLDKVKVTATYTDACTFRILAKGASSPTTILQDADGHSVDINASGQMHIVMRGDVCAGCSTSTPLVAGATFTGTSVDVLDYSVITVSVYSNVASATDGLVIEQSHDGVNWDFDDVYTIPAGVGKTFTVQPVAQYLRTKYTNGGSDQTTFRLQLIRKKTYSLPNSHRIQDSIINDDDAQLVKAVITGEIPSGAFVNFQGTTQGNFKVSLEELENNISVNSNTQLKITPYDSSGTELGSVSNPTTVKSYLTDEYGNTAQMLSDNIFLGAPIVISSEHHEIHCGDSYEATSNFTLGNGATRDFLIIVPNEAGTGQSQKLYHMLGKIEAESEISVTLYEGADRIAGTSVSSFNRNRNSSNTDTLDISHTPTDGTTDGTAIWGPWRVGTGRASAGLLTRNNEFVLKNNTKYILKITNQITSDNNVNVEFDYYVHPGV